MRNTMVTVVTVCYNAVEDLKKTVNSVINQTYRKSIEYIVIDGKSQDGSYEYLASLGNKIDVLISEPDHGIYDAMNKGIDHASGQWIFFLNAGDVFYENETLQKIFKDKDYINYDVLYGDVYKIKDNGLIPVHSDRPFFSHNHKYLSMGISHQGLFTRTSSAKMFKFDVSYKCCADFNQIYSIWEKRGLFCKIEQPIAIVEGRDGFSSRNRKIQMKEEAKILGIDKSLKFMFYYLYKSIRIEIKSLISKFIRQKQS